MQVDRHVLPLGDVPWGRMVAIAGFIMKFALRCVLHEVGEAVIPVIDHAAVHVDEKLAQYVLENGGWTTFALAFKSKKEEGGWVYQALVAVAAFVGINV